MNFKRLFLPLFSMKGVILLSFILRLALPLVAVALNNGDLTVFHRNDTKSYLLPAIELLDHGQFTSNGNPELLRTPGYVLFLIPGIILGNVEVVTIILQIILTCLTVYFVYKISLILFRNYQIATVSALLYAMDPISIYYTSSIMSETLFTFLTVLFIFYILNYLKSQQLRYLAIAAVFLTASIYVRPVNIYLPWATTLFILIFLIINKINYKKLVVHLSLFIFLSSSLTGLWQLRNNKVAAYPKFSSSADFNIYFNKAASVLASKEGIPHITWYEMREKYFAAHPEHKNFTRGKLLDSQGKKGKEIILENPWIYSKNHLKGMMISLLNPSLMPFARAFGLHSDHQSTEFLDIYRNQGAINTLIILVQKKPLFLFLFLILEASLIFYLAFALLALFSKEFLLNSGSLFILYVGSYLWSISSVPSASRYRVPIMPIICIMAGYGLFKVIQRIRAYKSAT